MSFTGQWKDGVEHGQGKCITADGATYDGQWKKGLRYSCGAVNNNPAVDYTTGLIQPVIVSVLLLVTRRSNSLYPV